MYDLVMRNGVDVDVESRQGSRGLSYGEQELSGMWGKGARQLNPEHEGTLLHWTGYCKQRCQGFNAN
jgi:hypothetical protein